MEFWDREKEIGYLKRYIQSEPNAILFVYGPKSSGKSTLLMKVVEKLSKRKRFLNWYKVYWFDLRGKFISSYENVVDMFFMEREVLEDVEEESGMKLNVLSFITVESRVKEHMKRKRLDPFEYMERVLKKNKRNVIVFDELQKLKEVYLNSPSNQRPLVKELFNFFVRLTKVLHLSHVIVMTSDTFFIERVYTDSTLKNTSEYYLVDFFDDDTAFKILKSHGFSDEDARYIVDWIGGVPWMIERVISKGINTVKELYEQVKSRVFDFLIDYQSEDEAKKVLKEIVKGDFKLSKENISVVRDLVEAEILFYDPINMVVKFQTKLDERAARELLEVN